MDGNSRTYSRAKRLKVASTEDDGEMIVPDIVENHSTVDVKNFKIKTEPDENQLKEMELNLNSEENTNLQMSRIGLRDIWAQTAEETDPHLSVAYTLPVEPNKKSTITRYRVISNYFTRNAGARKPSTSVIPTIATAVKDVELSSKVLGERSRSKIWNYFTKDLKSSSATCNLCNTTIKRSKGSTSGMMNHIRHKHKLKINGKGPRPTARASHAKIIGSTTCIPSASPKNSKAKAINNAIAYMIIRDYQPYTIVDGIGFKRLMKLLDSEYILPNGETLAKTIIPEKYRDLKEKLKSELKMDIHSLQSLTVTVEFWTSKVHKNCMNISVHYITPDFVKKQHLIGCKQFDNDPKGANIFREISLVLKEYAIPMSERSLPNKKSRPKLSKPTLYVMTENCRNLNLTVGKTNWEIIPCFGDSLRMAVEQGIKEDKDLEILIAKCQLVVDNFTGLTKSKQLLAKKAREFGINNHGLVKHEPGRWISLYHMLEHLLELRQPITALSEDNDETETPNDNEWKMLEALMNVLQPFEEATRLLITENHPSLSLVFPLICGIETELKMLRNEKMSNSFVVNYSKMFLKALKSIFKEYRNDSILVLCMVMDPRFKTVLLEQHEFIRIKNYLKKEVDNYLEENVNSEPADCCHATEEDTKTVTRSIWTSFHEKCKEKSAIGNSRQSIAHQSIETYLTMDILDKNQNIFLWWSENKHCFNVLSNIAQKFLAIPATSAESDCVFSPYANEFCAKRESLPPEHIEEISLLHAQAKNNYL